MNNIVTIDDFFENIKLVLSKKYPEQSFFLKKIFSSNTVESNVISRSEKLVMIHWVDGPTENELVELFGPHYAEFIIFGRYLSDEQAVRDIIKKAEEFFARPEYKDVLGLNKAKVSMNFGSNAEEDSQKPFFSYEMYFSSGPTVTSVQRRIFTAYVVNAIHNWKPGGR